MNTGATTSNVSVPLNDETTATTPPVKLKFNRAQRRAMMKQLLRAMKKEKRK